MKIKTPALERVHVATRYRSDFTLNETTYDVKVRRDTKTPIYAMRPTTATVLDYDFKAPQRLTALARTTALTGLLVVAVAATPVIGLYLIGRDLVGSVIRNVTDAFDAASWAVTAVGSSILQTAKGIVNP